MYLILPPGELDMQQAKTSCQAEERQKGRIPRKKNKIKPSLGIGSVCERGRGAMDIEYDFKKTKRMILDKYDR